MRQNPLSRTACAVVLAWVSGSPSSAVEMPVVRATAGHSAGPEAEKPEAEKPEAEKPEAEKPEAEKPEAEKKDGGEATEPDRWQRGGFALKKGQSSIALVGRLQVDLRHFDWDVQGDADGTERNPGHKLRRARIGSEAEFGKLSLKFVVDPRNSEAGSRLKDVTVGYAFSKRANLLAGYFKPSLSQENLTSSANTDFVDRNMAADQLSPDREWGVEMSGSLGRVGYAVGGFAGDGNSRPESSGASAAAKLIVTTVKGLEFAGSFMQGEVTADSGTGVDGPLPKGVSGETATGFTFWNPTHVKGTRRRLGSDLTYSRGPLKVQAEYLESREQREGQGLAGLDIPDVRGRGWNAQVSYVLTGETKDSTVTPERSLFKGGRGALEIVARVEALKFDDTGAPSGSPSFGDRASDISPSGSSAIQVGANYWASDFMKIQGSALWESYNDPRIAPVPGRKGRYFTLIARVQFVIP